MPDREPETLIDLFKGAVSLRPQQELLRFKRDNVWVGINGQRLFERVRDVTLGLHHLGIRKGDCVAILAESGPLWTISDYAILSNGAVNTPIYPTQAVNQVEYILRDAQPKLLIISTPRMYRRVTEAIEKFPDMAVASFELLPEVEKAITFEEIESIGAGIAIDRPELYDVLASEVKPSDLASIIYTSGTTGEPKGAMLSHANILFNALASGTFLEIEPDNIMLSFLPLSHIFERMVLYLCLHFGVQINYAGGIETVAADLKEVRPTLMSTVPRLLEKIYAKMQKTAAESGWFKRHLFNWSAGIARRVSSFRLTNRPVPFILELQRRVADRLVFKRLRQAVGGAIKRMVSGGAALPTDLALFFNGAGIPVLQGYGLTETAPVIAVNTLEEQRLGTVGRPLPGVEVLIESDGEILTRGPHVFRGYFGKEEETRDAFSDGWFRTGDIGHLDNDGFLVITDRKKDLIKTSSGKYVAPQAIENRLSTSEYIEQALVIGNNRKYVSALVVPNFDLVRTWVKQNGLKDADRKTLAAEPQIVAMIKSEVARLTRDLADYERVKRVAVVPNEFSIDGGELTPTLKVRRRIVEEKYRSLIESLYAGGSD